MGHNYLKGNITEYKFQLKIKFSDVENVTVDGLNRLFNTLLKLVIPQVNNYLNDGIPVPPLEPFFNLSKSEMTLLNQYIRFDFDPEPCKKQLELFFAQAFEGFKVSYAKAKKSRMLQEQSKPVVPSWLKIKY